MAVKGARRAGKDGEDMNDVRQPQALLDALRDAGLCGREVERFLALEAAGEREGQLRLLSAHRQQLLKRLHREEQRIDCLDYLLHRMRKETAKTPF